MGGMSDAIALILTSSVHHQGRHPARASWDKLLYTGSGNVPKQMGSSSTRSTTTWPSGGGRARRSPVRGGGGLRPMPRQTHQPERTSDQPPHAEFFKPYPLAASTARAAGQRLKHHWRSQADVLPPLQGQRQGRLGSTATTKCACSGVLRTTCLASRAEVRLRHQRVQGVAPATSTAAAFTARARCRCRSSTRSDEEKPPIEGLPRMHVRRNQPTGPALT